MIASLNIQLDNMLEIFQQTCGKTTILIPEYFWHIHAIGVKMLMIKINKDREIWNQLCSPVVALQEARAEFEENPLMFFRQHN
jgi:hypothetical protein